MVLHSRSMRRRVLMSVESLMRGGPGKDLARSRSLSPAAPASVRLQPGMALRFRQFAELLDCRVKTPEVAAGLGQHAAEAGHQLGIGGDRHEVRIVQFMGKET